MVLVSGYGMCCSLSWGEPGGGGRGRGGGGGGKLMREGQGGTAS
eukprot:COSAG02_NODE_59594_length_274_cov_0.520000_1_plen_43_part_01